MLRSPPGKQSIGGGTERRPRMPMQGAAGLLLSNEKMGPVPGSCRAWRAGRPYPRSSGLFLRCVKPGSSPAAACAHACHCTRHCTRQASSSSSTLQPWQRHVPLPPSIPAVAAAPVAVQKPFRRYPASAHSLNSSSSHAAHHARAQGLPSMWLSTARP